jgi:hypothetical protein
MSGQRAREACCATVVPQSTPIEGGYRPPESGSPPTRNLSICRQIRQNSFLRGWLRIPVAVLQNLRVVGGFIVVVGVRHSRDWLGRGEVVQRTCPEGLHIPVRSGGAELWRGVVERNAEEGVTWISSYVSEDKTRTFCIYDAPSPEAIRKTAACNALPVDRITRVTVLGPYFYV